MRLAVEAGLTFHALISKSKWINYKLIRSMPKTVPLSLPKERSSLPILAIVRATYMPRVKLSELPSQRFILHCGTDWGTQRGFGKILKRRSQEQGME